MRTIIITGSDTGIGKTRVTAALARLLSADGSKVQIVKPVETGRVPGQAGDAEEARSMAGARAEALTLVSLPLPLAPATAALAAGQFLSVENLVAAMDALLPCDWRLCEGAGGIATPIEAAGADWADFAVAAGADWTVIVVPDRLGAINQARLAFNRASQAGLKSGIWLNAVTPVDPAVAASNREGLIAASVPIWGELGYQAADAQLVACPWPAAGLPEAGGNAVGDSPVIVRDRSVTKTQVTGDISRNTVGDSPVTITQFIGERCRKALDQRIRDRTLRSLRITVLGPTELNLADNDYLELARDGRSASASPLITGWREPHQKLVDALCALHGFPCGLLWTSGYTANSALLGLLPAKEDTVFADRLIHNSMISGLRRCGARFRRYPHLDLSWLDRELSASCGATFVVTESLFSMEGDFPDLVRLAELKRKHSFFLVLDEAHALGWYGPQGGGLARAAGIEEWVDVLVGTLGKTLGSGGAYTLFRDPSVRDYAVNFAGEFIYSTALPPANAAAALQTLEQVRTLSSGQSAWHEASRAFRAALRAEGWPAPDGDSPIVPVRLDHEEAALSLADALAGEGIRVAAVRPPTVPPGTSRLRFSLKRTFGLGDQSRVLEAMKRWRGRQ